LKISRVGHAAGVFIDSVSKEALVVVAGGINKNKGYMNYGFTVLNSTEILKGDHWELGPALPKRLNGPSIIESGKESILLIGGLLMEYDKYGLGVDEGYNSIYKLQCALGTCSWTKLNQELQTGRHAFIAVPIHDAWTACRPGEKVSKLADTTKICYDINNKQKDCFSDYEPSAPNSDQYECDPDVIGGQRWKLDDNLLKNEANWIWKSVDSWTFTAKDDDLIYILNNSKTKVLRATSDGKVIQEFLVEGKADQLWKKGEPNFNGYFTLENSGEPKLLTAIFESGLEIKGNITMR